MKLINKGYNKLKFYKSKKKFNLVYQTDKSQKKEKNLRNF